ncbi:MAG: AMP-binding protein [Verrucomicrobiae bacterium]|nr:AMP-binding protein [Verrucomicrobiae bacterium]
MSDRIVAQNLAEMYTQAAARFGELPAFATRKKGGEWDKISYEELYEQGVCLATALMVRGGVQARDHVGILADNRREWIIADYGILLCGAADVPRGTDVTDGDITYIIPHADVKVLFVENVSMLKRVTALIDQLPLVRVLIVMDPAAEVSGGVLKMQDLIAEGRALRGAGDREVEERVAAIRPDDLFTLIYTSGTTGTPKGVQLTHANMISQVRNLPFALTPQDRLISILPIWHSYERVFEMVAICFGACTYYTSLRGIAEDLKRVRPTMMPSAPRLWEHLYLKIFNSVKSGPALNQFLFHTAYFCSRMVQGSWYFLTCRKIDLTGRPLPLSLVLGLGHALRALVFLIPYLILDALVLRKLRGVVGGCLRGTISGGGALQPHVDEFFNYIGIPVLEGYGMTETAPVLAVRSWKRLIIGTVGPIFPQTEIRIVDLNTGEILYPNASKAGGGRGLKGEIHAKGPQVMKGYYKNPEATAKVLKDGWMNTGDIGMVTFNDCLKIMGRSKDTIVLLSGENIEPIPIEARICQSPLVDQCMVVGQDQKQLGVLVVPSVEGYAQHGIQAATAAELAQNAAALPLMAAEIKRLVNTASGFKSFEVVTDFRLVPKAFEVGDEMTSTFKLKRHIITAKYQPLIDEMYKDTGRNA